MYSVHTAGCPFDLGSGHCQSIQYLSSIYHLVLFLGRKSKRVKKKSLRWLLHGHRCRVYI
ncbi:hypothetical protein CSUI_011170, partial [Cystoisospora suis]